VAAPGRVFITGRLGFIGGALAERLRALGAEVRGVDLRAEPDLDVVAGDVAAPGAWQDHAAGCDLVIHTAAVVSLRSSGAAFWHTNVRGTRHALEAAIRGGAGRFVHLSSVTVFGFDFPDGVDERHPVRPNGVPYIDTKVASEQVVLQAHAEGELACTVVRPGDVWGPRSRPWTVIPVEELRRRRFALPGMGRGIFSPLYIDNLVEGIVLAATRDEGSGRVFTLTDGAGISNSDFFDHYARMLGRRRAPVAPTPLVRALASVGSVLDREGEVTPNAIDYLTRRGTYSIERARSALGYEPAVGLEEGMARTERWLRDNDLLAMPAPGFARR
jgi:nucleoside-diphosphate-sugar epimerase